uniref:Uncharacterized protein n=1 Tax=Arundo donax TaxID=35708 RepID=A0A0A8YR13_ARUDO
MFHGVVLSRDCSQNSKKLSKNKRKTRFKESPSSLKRIM